MLCLFLVPVVVSAGGNISSAPLSSLEQIEPLISDDPEVLAAFSAISIYEALEAAESQRTGAKYFAGITYRYNKKIIYLKMGKI